MDPWLNGLIVGLLVGAAFAICVALIIWRHSSSTEKQAIETCEELSDRLAQSETYRKRLEEAIVELDFENRQLHEDKLTNWGIPDRI